MWSNWSGTVSLMSMSTHSTKHSTPLNKCKDVLIIGGGIIGMLCARELTLAGATVTLIEKNQTGKESSWAGGGILSPLYPWRYPKAVTALAHWSSQHYAALATSLQTETGIDSQLIQSGLLVLDQLSSEEQNNAINWANSTNNNIELLANSDLHCYFNTTTDTDTDTHYNIAALNKKFTQGILLPNIAQIRNPRLVKALKASLLLAGVNFVENEEVSDIKIQKNRVSHIMTQTNKQYHADNVVVASGAWSTPLLAKADIRIDVKPVRGQMILINAMPGLIRHIILNNNQYLIPRQDGRILVGSTLENVGFDKSVTKEAKQSLWETATDLLPALSQFSIEHHWAGLRPGSINGIPTIAVHPDINNLYINTGHFRNGVILGPASARLLTELITENRTILDPKPYALGQL